MKREEDLQKTKKNLEVKAISFMELSSGYFTADFIVSCLASVTVKKWQLGMQWKSLSASSLC